MRRSATRFGAALCAAGLLVPGAVLVAAAPAMAARGVSVEIQDLPEEFTAGARPTTFAAVASKSGGQCLKVRWSLVLRVDGIELDQVGVDRVEEDGSFPVDVQTDGDATRLTDVALDPGTLCRNRTVTAWYAVNFADDVAAGEVTFEIEAYDADLRLLEQDSATRAVVGDGSSPSPEPPPSEEPTEAPGAGAGAQPPTNTAAAGGGLSMPPIGFIVGAVMLFIGTGLLLQVRRRMRRGAVRPVRYDLGRAARRGPPPGMQRPARR